MKLNDLQYLKLKIEERCLLSFYEKSDDLHFEIRRGLSYAHKVDYLPQAMINTIGDHYMDINKFLMNVEWMKRWKKERPKNEKWFKCRNVGNLLVVTTWDRCLVLRPDAPTEKYLEGFKLLIPYLSKLEALTMLKLLLIPNRPKRQCLCGAELGKCDCHHDHGS